MIKINLMKEQLYEYLDQTNALFHYRFQFCCIVVIVMMFVLSFIYG
jgi:hypothetical protein